VTNNLQQAGVFLFGAVFFAYDLVVGLKERNIRLLYTKVRKNDHPIVFWYGVALSVLLIGVALALFVYYLGRG
jgi:hypothetical protein